MPSPTNNHLPTARNTSSWLLLITANTLWAASYVAAKLALQDTSVNVMLALRMGISALLLLPFLIARRSQLHLTRQLIPQLLALALIGFVINKLLEFGGLALTTASDVALFPIYPPVVACCVSSATSWFYWPFSSSRCTPFVPNQCWSNIHLFSSPPPPSSSVCFSGLPSPPGKYSVRAGTP